jgi:hypothetical protein
MKILHKFILESMNKKITRFKIHGLNDGFNPTMRLSVKYEFTQSRPRLNLRRNFILVFQY